MHVLLIIWMLRFRMPISLIGKSQMRWRRCNRSLWASLKGLFMNKLMKAIMHPVRFTTVPRDSIRGSCRGNASLSLKMARTSRIQDSYSHQRDRKWKHSTITQVASLAERRQQRYIWQKFEIRPTEASEMLSKFLKSDYLATCKSWNPMLPRLLL